MTDRVGIQVEGARELRASLKKADLELNDLHEAHTEAAQLVAQKSQPKAPRVTGRLAGTVRGSGTKAAAIARAGNASVPYAGPIHFGWEARNIAPNPFITETVKDEESTIVALYEDAVERVLDTIKGA